MSRSVKDLRELINISRLSFHGEEESFGYLSDEGDESPLDSKPATDNKVDKTASAKSKCPVLSDSKTNLNGLPERHLTNSSAINSRFKPLPAIKSKSTESTNLTITKSTPDRVSKPVGQKSLGSTHERSHITVLEHIESDAVNAWLVRANDTVNLLSNWISIEGNFARFSHFWLSEITRTKQQELIELETGIIIEEIEFALRSARQCKHKDIVQFFQLILWEYPAKLCGDSNSSLFLLDTLVILASGKKDSYRRLLANVKSTTKDPEHIHRILSARAFSLISIVASVINFFLSLSGKSLLGCKTSHRKSDHLRSDLVVDAVRLGHTDVLEYFIAEQNMDISDVENESDLSVIFLAVSAGKHGMVEFLLKILPDIDINQVSTSGNSLLHVAVNSGNIDLVRLLLTAGADVNQANSECDNATPLHLAVMQGDIALVSVLLQAGANVNDQSSYDGDVMTSCTPLKLAQDLDMTELVELLMARLDTNTQ